MITFWMTQCTKGRVIRDNKLPYIFVIVKKEATQYVDGQDLKDERHLGKNRKICI